MEEYLSAGKTDENKIAGIIVDETSITEEEIEKLLKKGESKDLAFALDRKVIHDIRDPQVPKGANFISINYTGNTR